MALPSTIQDRDFRNFDDNGDGTTSRWVKIFGGGGTGEEGGLLSGVTYDNGDVAYPDAVTHVYTFRLSAATVAVVTLVFTDATYAKLSTFAVVK